MIDLVPLGDRGWLARFATEDEAGRWAAAVRRQAWPGVVDVVLAYATVGIHADPDRLDVGGLGHDLQRLGPVPPEAGSGRSISVPVLYDGEDLAEAAARLGLAPPELIDAHAGRDYHVYALGFRPGFPYAGYLPERIAGLPRRSPPRTRVPAGSVAIVGRQTAIYPVVSPGGWHLIGRTPLTIVDLSRSHFPVQAGDRLRFVPIDREEYQTRLGEWLDP